MADSNRVRGSIAGNCEGEGGERGERGKRGHRGHRGHRGPAANAVPTPAFALTTTTIYARLGGSDKHGKGTLDEPFATFEFAIRNVPSIITPGNRFIVDITGIGVETLPEDWACPPIACSQEHISTVQVPDPVAPYFLFATPLTIRAIPQLASSLSPADAQIDNVAGANVSLVGPGLVKVTLPVARAAWVPGTLRGLLAVKSLTPDGYATVFDNTTTELFLAITPGDLNGGVGPLVLSPGEVLAIMEPSATLQAPPADNFTKEPIEFGGIDAINFQGIQFQNTMPNIGGGSLLIDSVVNPALELCVINEVTMIGCDGLGPFIRGCVVRGLFDMYDDVPLVERCYFDGVGTSFAFFLYGTVMAWVDSVFEGCIPFGGGPFIPTELTFQPTTLQLIRCWLRNSLGDALTILSPTRLDLLTVQIDNAAGNGITATGPLQVSASEVTGTGNAGVGINFDDGTHVLVDAATTIGNADGRAYANGGVPVAAWPGVPFNDTNLTTLSRVWQP